MIAGTNRPKIISSIVCRAARPDLAGDALERVSVPCLFVVGQNDSVLVTLNRQAMEKMPPGVTLHQLPGVGHDFVEPGALESLADVALQWFNQHTKPNRAI